MQVSFVAKNAGGRPPTWQAGEDIQLLQDAEHVQQGRRLKFADVVRELLKTERYKTYTFENLDARFREARRNGDERKRQLSELLGSDEEAVRTAFGPLWPTDEKG